MSAQSLPPEQAAVVAVLRQIGDFDPDDPTIRFVECGLHSGFPPCCVAFFVQVWWPANVMEGRSRKLREVRALVSNYRRVLDRMRDDYEHVEYIPCPDCVLSKRFVAMKKCTGHFTKRQRDQIRRHLAA